MSLSDEQSISIQTQGSKPPCHCDDAGQKGWLKQVEECVVRSVGTTYPLLEERDPRPWFILVLAFIVAPLEAAVLVRTRLAFVP